MNTLQRYIARRVAAIATSSFLAILGVVWVTQALTRIDFAMGSGQSIAAFLTLILALTPQLIALVLPFGVVIGVVQVFNTMNSDSELAVMSAAGVSRGTRAWPVLLIAAAASAWLPISNNFVEPAANRAGRDVLVSARSDLLTSMIREGVFTRIDKDLTIYVDKRLPGNQLSGIMVSDTRDDDLALLYYAQTGAVGRIGDKEVLVMTNGQIHRDNADGALSIIRFNSYAISLAQFTSASGKTQYYPDTYPTAELINPDPNDRLAKDRPSWLSAELHRRMTDWMYPILFALIGLVVAGQTQSHRQTRFNAYFLALGGAMLYRWGAYAAYSATRANADVWPLMYIIPVGGIAINALLFRFGVAIALPQGLLRQFDRASAAWTRLRVRMARARTT